MTEDTCKASLISLASSRSSISFSYALLYGGSILMCFSLFMLSLCKPDQFYQVHPFFILSSFALTSNHPDLPRSRPRCRPRRRCTIRPERRHRSALLPAPAPAGDVHRLVRLCPRRRHPPDHAQQHPPQLARVRQRRPRERRPCERAAARRVRADAPAAPAI
jgi:hypothetical protein